MNEHGPLLRDLISTADHPIGNIPPESRLRDLVGTAPTAGVDLTPIGGYNLTPSEEAELDAFVEDMVPTWRLFDVINWHVDRNLEYLVEHPEVYANHEHYEVAS